MNSGAGRDVIELWGREFNIVKSGLSEAQVVSFVNDLVKQHDGLLQRQQHLEALTKLAERSVSEADKLAQEMKKEAADRANSEAARIIAEAEKSAKSEANRLLGEAEQRGQQMIKEREDQAMAAVAKQAEAMKADAERLAAEVKQKAETEAARIEADAESRGRHIIEQKEAEAVEAADELAKEIMSKAESEAAGMLEREKDRIQPQLSQFVHRLHSQLLSELDSLKDQVGSLDSKFAETLFSTEVNEAELDPRRAGQSQRVSSREQENERQDELLDLVGSGSDVDPGEPQWDVEILPPIDIMKIMSIVGHLDSLPGVVKTEIIPRNDRTSVTVYLDEPVELVDVVKSLPEVAHAEESTVPDDGSLRRISLALSAKTGDAGQTTSQFADTAVRDKGK